MAVVEQETAPFRSQRHSPQKTTLYVGDLHSDVTEEDLMVKFSSKVPIVSVYLCRCSSTDQSRCYGFVNFDSCYTASNALACLNHTGLKGKTMRIMWFEKDLSKLRSGIGNLFVKNLHCSITSSCLERIFSPFGTILSCKVAEEDGQSKGFGFVQFDLEQSAAAARCALHGTLISGKKMYVAKFIKKNERAAMSGKHDFTNLYVKNLSEDATEDFLLETFGPYGRVSSAMVMRDETGLSRRFGFVSFFEKESAKKATKALNGAVFGSNSLFVGRAQTKAERVEMLKLKLKEKFISEFMKLKLSNLYVKNLSESIDETRLREIFERYGQVVSAKVMRHQNGVSKGSGFVCFSNPEESKQAKRELNGSFIDGKSLVVRVAERKEARRKRLEQIPDSAPHLLYFAQFPALSHLPPMPGSYTYIHPFHIRPSFNMTSQPFLPNVVSYIPVRGQVQPNQNENTQDKTNKRMPSAYGSVTGKTSDLKSGVSTMAVSLEEATSLLKAALLNPPPACGSEKAEGSKPRK